MKINELTKDQVARLPEIRDEWIKIGLSCEPLDFEQAKLGVKWAYEAADLTPPTWHFVADSPLSGAMMSVLLHDFNGKISKYNGTDQAWKKVVDQLIYQGIQVDDSQIIDDTDKLWDQVRDKIGNQVWGAHDAPWLAFYAALAEFGLAEELQKLKGLWHIARHCGWWAPYKDYVILQHRHCALHFDAENRIHHDGGLAIEYADGWGVWALHGVRVPQWLAEERDGDIDPNRMQEIKNAEIRREFVRKIGLDRIRYKLQESVIDSKVIVMKTPLSDEWGCNYSVEQLNYGNGVNRRVLVMDNPSLPEVQHVEYVPQDCMTVEQAMNFRLNREESEVDDENGSPYWIHGDVILRPKGATTTKRWPEIIA